MSSWSPYKPTDAAPWNIERVVHLHRRAAFAATWREIERDLRDGPEVAITRLIVGEARLEGVPDGFESLAAIIGQAAVDSGSAERLKAWWLYRCLFSPHPLQERLTLMWHNHFATSNLKVDDLRLMKRQNDLFRQHALSPFGELLAAMIRNPALLKFLDAPSNRKEHPNENLARELMELFTLGIGHYSEEDVKQAARALTGWTVRQGEFLEQPAAHDDTDKTILGQSGNWNGSDLLRILLEQPATARRLAWRLCSELCGERVVDDKGLDELADGLRQHNLDIRWGVETILRSELFFSKSNLGAACAIRRRSSSGRCGRWNAGASRRARSFWPSGSAGWSWICFIRRTWQAGRGTRLALDAGDSRSVELHGGARGRRIEQPRASARTRPTGSPAHRRADAGGRRGVPFALAVRPVARRRAGVRPARGGRPSAARQVAAGITDVFTKAQVH